MKELFYSIRSLFLDWHWFDKIDPSWQTFFLLCFNLLLCWLLYEFMRRLVIPLIMVIQKKTIKAFGLRFINEKALMIFNQIILGWFFYVILPTIFFEESSWEKVLLRVTAIFIMVAILRLINTLIEAVIMMVQRNRSGSGPPMKGVYQLLQIILIVIGIVLSIAILFDKSPTALLAGLGASAAVLMLVFKDTILGFVSGIQLTYNDMLRVGDWISMPKFGADGNVEEITLNTVKVRNFDNTLSMVPPYALVTDAFQNWRFMQLSGGRRIMRSFIIDAFTVSFCTEDQLILMRKIPMMATILDKMEIDLKNDPFKHTNLGLFRTYITEYLRQSSLINQELTLMVRQLESSSEGIPVQVYCFSSNKEWVAFEMIQSGIMEHIFSSVPYFSLKVYERNAAPWAPTLTEYINQDYDT